jgi:hypothetical protein
MSFCMTSGTFIIMIVVMVPALLFSVPVVILIEERSRVRKCGNRHDGHKK